MKICQQQITTTDWNAKPLKKAVVLAYLRKTLKIVHYVLNCNIKGQASHYDDAWARVGEVGLG